MQPPPRKGTSAKFLKNLHAEQIAKLQVKNQTECELLEDLRSFMIKKSALEKSYSEAVLKITSVYLNKKVANIPDLKTEGSEERWNMWSVWRNVLEETEKLCKARLAAIEIYQQQISDDVKILRLQKLQNSKKCIDQLNVIQKELQSSVQDLDKAKKSYFDEEHCAHDVRDKAKDMESRLKRKKGSFFQSLSTLQKSSAKASQKRDMMDDKSAGARNDYLICLAVANSHQTRYFVNDLQSIMQAMENSVYERVQEYFALIGRVELLTCSAQQSSFSKIRDQAQQLTREYNLQCLYLYYPVLKQHIQYKFEACNGDTTETIILGYGNMTVESAAEEVKEWFYTVLRQKQRIELNLAKLQTLNSLRESGQKTDPNDPNGPDIETKIEDIQEEIRKSEVIKIKTEAKIEVMKSGDDSLKDLIEQLQKESSSTQLQRFSITGKDEAQISLDTNVSSSGTIDSSQENYETSDEEVENVATPSVTRSQSIPQQPPEFEPDNILKQIEASWDDTDGMKAHPEDGISDDTSSVASSKPGPLRNESDIIFKCTALYNYEAQNPDELSLTANEELEILGEGDGDGWLKARNQNGEVGFVPCTYLDSLPNATYEIEEDASVVHLTSQISFSSVDYIVDEAEPGELNSEKSASLITIHEVEKPTNLELKEEAAPAVGSAATVTYCKALYDYDTYIAEELSFSEGDIIIVLRKTTYDGVDDGWWEGEIGNRRGLFPSLVVQECTGTGEILSPEEIEILSGDDPPPFTPPEPPAYAFVQQEEQTATEITTTTITITTEASQDLPSSAAAEPPKIPEICVPDVPDVCIQINDYDDPSGELLAQDEIGKTDSAEPAEDSEESQDNCLGVTQIVITAPTPGADNSDKTFPPPPPPAPADAQTIAMERRKSAGEINEAEPPLYDVTLVECGDYPSTIIEEPEDLTDENDGDSAKFDDDISRTDNDHASIESDDGIPEQIAEIALLPSDNDLPPTIAVTTSASSSNVVSSSSATVIAVDTVSADTSGTTSSSRGDNISSCNSSGSISGGGVTIVGEILKSDVKLKLQQQPFSNGVPDQLEPHQLERLQELKESNA